MKIKVVLKEGHAAIYGGDYLSPQQLGRAQSIAQSWSHLLTEYKPVSLDSLADSIRQLFSESGAQSQAETLAFLSSVGEKAMAVPVRMHQAPMTFPRRRVGESGDRAALV